MSDFQCCRRSVRFENVFVSKTREERVDQFSHAFLIVYDQDRGAAVIGGSNSCAQVVVQMNAYMTICPYGRLRKTRKSYGTDANVDGKVVRGVQEKFSKLKWRDKT
jgi:hypothetical protein